MWSEWSVKQCLETHVILSQCEMTILTIDEFYCKNAAKFKKHAALNSLLNGHARSHSFRCHISPHIYISINFILSTMAVTRGICLSLSLLLWIATWGFVCVCVCLFVCVCVCVCSLSSCVLLRLGRCVWGGGSFYSCVCCREGSWGNRVCLCVFVHKHIQPATALIKKEASILHICYWKQNSKTLKECIEVLSKPNN